MIVFDIGASDGNDSLKYAENPENTVYAFEPVPEMYIKLLEKSLQFPNYLVYPFAIDSKNAVVTFNIDPEVKFQCSSLLDFVDDFSVWPQEKQVWFKVNRKIELVTIRIDTFIRKFCPNLKQIDILHCDTQGKDLDVLESFGSYISLIQNGKVEAIVNSSAALYKNQRNALENMKIFFEKNGFKIDKILPDHYMTNNECDLIFSKI